MKRKVSFGIAVLMILVACLFVSCNSEVSTAAQVNDGKLVYATFDKSSKGVQRPDSETFIQSYVIDSITDVYWMYSATKADAGGATGATDGKRVNGTKGLTGNIGPLSKGYWNFTLNGYKWTGEGDDPTTAETTDFTIDGYTHVFAGSANNVLLNVDGTTEENPAPIDITVNLVTESGIGWITVSNNFRFYWKEDGASSTGAGDYELKLKVYVNDDLVATSSALTYVPATENDDEYYTLDSNWVISAAAGDLTYTVKLVHPLSETDDIVYRSGEATSKVYAGQTTMIDATMIEGLQVDFVVFNAESTSPVIVSTSAEQVSETAGSVSFTTNYTPAGGTTVSDNKTTVDINNAGDVIPASTTYKLGVETSNIIAAGSKFSVASNSTAVASVDLTLTKTVGSETITVSDFGEGAATVTTYIAKNLTDVAFFYEDTAFTKVDSTEALDVNKFYYEGSSGKLVFMTSHFSEFYVTSTDEAYNATQVKAHTTLENAVDNAADNDEIILLKDINFGSNRSLLVNKTIDLNLNNKSISGSHDPMIVLGANSATYEPTTAQLTNSGHLSIKGEGSITSTNWDMFAVFPDATLDIYSGEYSGLKCPFYIFGGTLNTYGGDFTVTNPSNNYIVQVKSAGTANIIGGSFHTPESGGYGVYLDNASVCNFGSLTGDGPSFNTWRPCIASNGSESHSVLANIYSGTYRANCNTPPGECSVIQLANATSETQTLNIYGGTFEQAGSNEDRSIFNVRYNGTININVNGGTFAPASSTRYFNGVGSSGSGWPTTGNVNVVVTNGAIPAGTQEVKVYNYNGDAYIPEKDFEIIIQ